MRPSNRQQLAAEELSRLEGGFLYKDHRLFEAGQYREIAQRFRKQARYQFWLGVASSIVFAAWNAMALVDYGATGNLTDLIIGVGTLAFSFAQQAFWTRSSLRIEMVATHVLQLLDQDEAHAHEADRKRR